MPIKHAAFKALRKSIKNAKRNSVTLENIKYLGKKALKAIAEKNAQPAKEFTAKFIKAVDKAVQVGILKKNTAARKKSRLARRLNAILGGK